MITEMSELKEITLHKLLTTPVEENERNNYLYLVSKRERHNAGIIAKLEQQLEEARTDKMKEVIQGVRKTTAHSFIIETCL